MIIETITQQPFIHFGVNAQSKTIALGQSVTVWQDTLYSDNYTVLLDSSPFDTNNKTTIIPTAIGTYNLQVEVNERNKGISLQSNTIILNVI